MSRARVLLTGGHGFLGSAVSELVSRHFGTAAILRPNRDELDLSDYPTVRAYWDEHRPTALIHLAAFARGLGGNMQARERAFLANEPVMRSPLLAALEFGVDAIFYAGTVAEYGHPYICLPLCEEDVLTGMPHSGEIYYALAKRSAQNYLEAIHSRWGTEVTHGLITNMYGPGDRYDPVGGHVVAAMLVKISEASTHDEDSVSLWGKPTTTRDFMYVEDVANCIVELLYSNSGLVNIGTGITTSMEQVAQAVCRALCYQGDVVWDSSKPVGIEHRSLDVSRLAMVVDLDPVAIDDGIMRTVSAESWLQAVASRAAMSRPQMRNALRNKGANGPRASVRL